MGRREYLISIVAVTVLMAACRKPYNPPAIASPGSYLVVEGVINAGADSTTIKLSRTVNLSSQITNNPVNSAVVAVQSDQNISYPLVQTAPGTYACAGLNLNSSHQYRLSINTGSEQYLSDYVPVLNSPPIDTVGFTINSGGINIYNNTHDPSNTVKYYRWDYQETWLYHPVYQSLYYWDVDTVLARTTLQQQQVYDCYPTESSSNIVLGSSAKLSQDVIVNNPITSVASTSMKLAWEYSILVRQYALTGQAYNFWQILENNTENLGSIFDAQPSQVPGNIHSVNNAAEPVMGYISVGSVAAKRIFIKNSQIPYWIPTPLFSCIDTAFSYQAREFPSDPLVNQVDYNFAYNVNGYYPYIPINAISMPGSPPIGYTAGSPQCTECTFVGTNVKPAFWQ